VWSFYKYDSVSKADELVYDVRPEVKDYLDNEPVDPNQLQVKSK
jgi:hypothetical protein